MIPRRDVILAAAATSVPPVTTETQRAAPEPAGAERMLLTIFLRHDESKTVDEINDHLAKTGWYEKFPPAGVEIVSWHVLMGIGQVVMVSFPPDRLRDLNRTIEGAAWGGYRTEFYPTYDYRALWEEAKAKAKR